MDSRAQVIVFSSQKGGSGKTTLSGHIAVQARLSGCDRIGIVDTDPQQSLSDWHQAREEDDLHLKFGDGESIARDIQELRDLGVSLIVVDTPPAANASIASIVRHADLVCIPARPSPHDLRSVGKTIDLVEPLRKPMIFVLNGAPVRAMITRQAALSLCQYGTVAPVIIHNRVDFASSMSDGWTAMEIDPEAKSSEEMRKLWDYIAGRIDRKLSLKSKMQTATASPEPSMATPTG